LLLLLVRLALAWPAARSGRQRRREPCPPAIGPRMASRAKRAQAPARAVSTCHRPSHGQPREAGAGAAATPPPPTRSALAWPGAKRALAPARAVSTCHRPSHGQPREAGG